MSDIVKKENVNLVEEKCPKCKGRKYLSNKEPCDRCNGTGYVQKTVKQL